MSFFCVQNSSLSMCFISVGLSKNMLTKYECMDGYSSRISYLKGKGQCISYLKGYQGREGKLLT